MFKDKVVRLLNNALGEDESLFLVDFSIKTGNEITIVLDGDQGVTVEDCVKISRAIEHNLDREEEDFSLKVASAGAASPMVLPRQYKKNIGRKLMVSSNDELYEGELTSVTDDAIILEWKARESKPIGKGKITVRKRKEINFSDVKEAKVILKF